MNRLSLKTFARLGAGFAKQIVSGCSKKNKLSPMRNVFRHNFTGDFYIDFAFSEKTTLHEKALISEQYVHTAHIEKDAEYIFDYVMSAGTRSDYTFCDVETCAVNFDTHMKESYAYNSELLNHISTDDEMYKALFVSCLNCSLSSYKELGRFKGFLAGVVYQSPARTYFRDGYWTVLSVLPFYPQYVRSEIITLSHGIDKNGNCPSAVKSDFSNWWGNHYDSPSFYVMMVHDYAAYTKDFSIFSEKIGRQTVLELCVKALDKLGTHTDCTGLIVKEPTNRRDWADNVFRVGYVTYDEALYCRALANMGSILTHFCDERAVRFASLAQKVKESINALLWDSAKGYYVNYRSDDYCEDNLSIDTVVTVLYDIADAEQKKSILSKMESMLESKNNAEQKAGDFGTMCVYPFYKHKEHVILKSTLDYNYHNGSDWPYLSGLYAYTKMINDFSFEYPLTRWFTYTIDRDIFTPVEFFSVFHPSGSRLQAWSSMSAFAMFFGGYGIAALTLDGEIVVQKKHGLLYEITV